MTGCLTKLFSKPHFSRSEDANWHVFMTHTGREKAAKTRMDRLGIENYLPLITVPSGTDGKSRMQVQLSNTIFIRCDLRQHPGLDSAHNFVYRHIHHPVSRENEILHIMESCWRIEELSQKYPVEGIRLSSALGVQTTLTGGALSGSTGYYDETDGCFYQPLPGRGFYAKITLKKKI